MKNNIMEQERLLRQGLALREAFWPAAVQVRETLMRQENVGEQLQFPRDQWQALSDAITGLQNDPGLHPLERYLLEYAVRTHPLIGAGMTQVIPNYGLVRAQWHLSQALLLALYGDPAAEGEVQMLLERAPQVLEKIGLTLDDLPQGLRNLPTAPWYQQRSSNEAKHAPSSVSLPNRIPIAASYVVPRRAKYAK